MDEQFHLDDQAQLALEVAQHAAVANGDGHCGTEYLLYGLVVTASSDLTEMVDLFALNALRVDRSIDRLINRRKEAGTFAESAPLLSLRAQHALCTPRLDGRAPTGVFEVLHGLLADDDSGACHVLRDLGVSPAEARRLTAYGIRHLSKDEVDALIADLDRRSNAYRSWWGPKPGTTLRPIFDPNGGEQPDGWMIATSESAQARLRAVGSNADGFGLTVVVRSLRDWVLPPVFEPVESLVPGHGATFTNGPDFFLVQAAAADGMVLDNRHLGERFAHLAPERPRLIRIGHREERRVLNDRRVQNLNVITTDWWAWPLPVAGPIEIRVDWPAESLSGMLTFDAAMLRPTS